MTNANDHAMHIEDVTLTPHCRLRVDWTADGLVLTFLRSGSDGSLVPAFPRPIPPDRVATVLDALDTVRGLARQAQRRADEWRPFRNRRQRHEPRR